MGRKKKTVSIEKTITPQPKTLDEVHAMFKGKGGGPEAEAIVVDSKMDKDFVNVFSGKHDVAKIIERCRKDILGFKVTFDQDRNPIGCDLQVARKAFRGIHCAFRTSK